MNIIEIKSVEASRADIFGSLTEAQLRQSREAETGLFIAESPKVIRVAMDAGYEPFALLCERKHITGDAADIIARCGDIPIYTGERNVLASLTGYTLTRGVLGAMTQGSLLLTQGARVDDERIREAASLLQTTSPNQLLMASIDIARMQMATEGRARWANALRLADELRAAVNSIDGLHCLGADDCATPSAAALDRTKVTVNVTGLRLTGPEAEHILRYDYKIQCELADARNVLFLITYADTDATVGRLIQALQSLAETYRKSEIPSETGASARASVLTKCATDELRKDGAAAQDGAPRDSNAIPFPPVPIAAVDPRTAFFAPKERIPFERAAGRIAAEQIMFYPPGIPILAPGDQITAAAIAYIRAMQRVGRKVVGPEDTALATAKVLQETDNERKEAAGRNGQTRVRRRWHQ